MFFPKSRSKLFPHWLNGMRLAATRSIVKARGGQLSAPAIPIEVQPLKLFWER